MALGIMFATRVLPVLIIVLSSVVLPWFQRTYLIGGFSGKNFNQTNVDNCDVIYPDKLIGCEDIHVYNSISGPLMFMGCVDKLEDQLVSTILPPS